jgi:hypothetical protein
MDNDDTIENLLDASLVAPGLLLGPMPATPRFVRSLHHNLEVTGIVSLQTNVDLLTLGFDWKQMAKMLREGGISAVERVPVPDFDERSLALALDAAVAAIHRLRDEQGLTVYVHCTAGVNRSPTAVIAYLEQHGGFSLDEAWDEVHRKRRVLPHRSALELWRDRREQRFNG